MLDFNGVCRCSFCRRHELGQLLGVELVSIFLATRCGVRRLNLHVEFEQLRTVLEEDIVVGDVDVSRDPSFLMYDGCSVESTFIVFVSLLNFMG